MRGSQDSLIEVTCDNSFVFIANLQVVCTECKVQHKSCSLVASGGDNNGLVVIGLTTPCHAPCSFGAVQYWSCGSEIKFAVVHLFRLESGFSRKVGAGGGPWSPPPSPFPNISEVGYL